MCPLCLAASGLYVAGGLSAGAVTTFLAAKLLRKRPEPTASTTSTERKETTMQRPTIASRDEWAAARKRLLVKEKELSRQRDALSAERRKLPMVTIEKEYVFQGPEGAARSPICSKAGISYSSTISCLTRPGTRDALAARSWPITSRAASCTSPHATPRSL